jgi:hypothetical protein
VKTAGIIWNWGVCSSILAARGNKRDDSDGVQCLLESYSLYKKLEQGAKHIVNISVVNLLS